MAEYELADLYRNRIRRTAAGNLILGRTRIVILADHIEKEILGRVIAGVLLDDEEAVAAGSDTIARVRVVAGAE